MFSTTQLLIIGLVLLVVCYLALYGSSSTSIKEGLRTYKKVGSKLACNWKAGKGMGTHLGMEGCPHGAPPEMTDCRISLEDAQRGCDNTENCEYISYVFDQWGGNRYHYASFYDADNCQKQWRGENRVVDIYKADIPTVGYCSTDPGTGAFLAKTTKDPRWSPGHFCWSEGASPPDITGYSHTTCIQGATHELCKIACKKGGVDCGAITPQPDPANIVTYNGKQYATVTQPRSPTDLGEKGAEAESSSACFNANGGTIPCEGYIPDGWSIAPNNADTIYVISSYCWGGASELQFGPVAQGSLSMANYTKSGANMWGADPHNAISGDELATVGTTEDDARSDPAHGTGIGGDYVKVNNSDADVLLMRTCFWELY